MFLLFEKVFWQAFKVYPALSLMLSYTFQEVLHTSNDSDFHKIAYLHAGFLIKSVFNSFESLVEILIVYSTIFLLIKVNNRFFNYTEFWETFTLHNLIKEFVGKFSFCEWGRGGGDQMHDF